MPWAPNCDCCGTIMNNLYYWHCPMCGTLMEDNYDGKLWIVPDLVKSLLASRRIVLSERKEDDVF